MSILSKFPSDVDSRVFWSASLRDLLYDVTYAAAQILLSRIKGQPPSTNHNPCAYTIDLASELIQTAINSRVLTSQQVDSFRTYAKQESIPLAEYDESVDELPEQDQSIILDSEPLSQCEPMTPGNADVPMPLMEKPINEAPFDELAREFGIETHLVQALAQRLAGLSA